MDRVQFSSVQSLSHVRLFATLWTAAHQACLSITNAWSLLKFMSIKSVMAFTYLFLCHSLLLLPSIFLSIRVYSFLYHVVKVLELQLQHQSFHWNHDTILICFLNVIIWGASHVSKLFVQNIIINTRHSFFLLLHRTLQKTILFRNL